MSEQMGLPQTQQRIDLVNQNQQLEERVLRLLDVLRHNIDIDQRWLAIARTDLQKGFMALNRSVFQPGRVALPEDAAGGA